MDCGLRISEADVQAIGREMTAVVGGAREGYQSEKLFRLRNRKMIKVFVRAHLAYP